MKRTPKVVLASAFLSLPIGGTLQAQRAPTTTRPIDICCKTAGVLKYVKIPAESQIIGLDNGATVYQTARGERFFLDPATGDMVFIPEETFARFTDKPPRMKGAAPLRMYKWSPEKYSSPITVIGMDEAGHVVHQNARGEKFYLDPATADMVFVK